MNASEVFSALLSEALLFLRVVMGTNMEIPEQRQGWTTTVSNGQADSSVQHLEYIEHDSPTEMPARGTCSSVPLRPVQRPDFSLRGIDGTIAEQWLPTDVGDLCTAYRGLAADQGRQFQQAAAKWQEAMKLFHHDHSTLSFSLMVVACEALKPRGKEFRDHNIYPIVEALLWKAVADKLLEPWFLPQRVRNAHLHSGEFRGTEFMETALMGPFKIQRSTRPGALRRELLKRA